MTSISLVLRESVFSEIILYSGQVFWYYIFYALDIFNGALDIKQYSPFKRSANEGFISGTMAFPQAPLRWKICSYSKTLHSVNLGALCHAINANCNVKFIDEFFLQAQSHQVHADPQFLQHRP